MPAPKRQLPFRKSKCSLLSARLGEGVSESGFAIDEYTSPISVGLQGHPMALFVLSNEEARIDDKTVRLFFDVGGAHLSAHGDAVWDVDRTKNLPNLA
jgi:hypothetical protein